MNSPELARFVRTIESPTRPCPVCAQQGTHRSFCAVRDLRKITRRLVPSNPNFQRRFKLPDGLQQQLLDRACETLLSRGVYDVLGIDETYVQHLLSAPSVVDMWASTQRMTSTVSFFIEIDQHTASKVSTVRRALRLYVQVKRLGGVNYQMLEPEKLAFVEVLRYSMKCWAIKNRRAIRAFASRRRPSTKNINSTRHLVLPPAVSERRDFFRFY